MPSQVKEKLVQELAEELKSSSHIVVTEYQGMTAQEFDELRGALRPFGAKYKVVKNRLVRIALKQSGIKGLDTFLKGPSAIAYLGADSASLTKALFQFGEQHKNFKVKAGSLFGSIADSSVLKTIATLPSREVLLAILLARLNSPLQVLAATMQEPLRALHAALSAVAKKKEPKAA